MIKKVYTYGNICVGDHNNVILPTVIASVIYAGTEFYINHSHPYCTGHENDQFSTGFGDQAVVDWLGATGIYLTEPSTGNVYLYQEGGLSIDEINSLIKDGNEKVLVGNVDYKITEIFDCEHDDLFDPQPPY